MSGLVVDHDGAELRASPNFGPRIGTRGPDMIVLHYTGMASGAAAEDWLCDPASQVSSHYLVHEDGRIVQMVGERDRAWHAGKSFWAGEMDINSASVGIEIVNPGHALGYADFPDRQVVAVMALCGSIAMRHAVRPERVLAHSDVAPGRKIDPGEKFPWLRLAEAGVGLAVQPEPEDGRKGLVTGDRGSAVEALQVALAQYGYGIEVTGVYDPATAVVVRAFQLHFRQGCCNGVADGSTLATLDKLMDLREKR